jgi:hypothetical protein
MVLNTSDEVFTFLIFALRVAVRNNVSLRLHILQHFTYTDIYTYFIYCSSHPFCHQQQEQQEQQQEQELSHL